MIRLGGQTHTSRVVDNSLDPEWGQVRTVHRVCRATYLKLLEVTWRAGAALTRVTPRPLQEFAFTGMLSDFLREKLVVDIFDKDTLTADDPLGGCAPHRE